MGPIPGGLLYAGRSAEAIGQPAIAFAGKDLLTNGVKQGIASALSGHGIHCVFVASRAHSRPMNWVDGEDVMTVSSLLSMAGSDHEPTAIDEDHLRRMTLGDRRLEREVLEIFARQTIIMLDRISGAGPALAAATAHTLMGSARGIGAWRVAQAAERLEQAAIGQSREAELDEAVEELKAATLEAGAAIGARLGNVLHDY